MIEPMRLIADGPLPAAVNMARDEALLAAMACGAAPVLRFYQWDPPAVSLGYFQPVEQYEAHAGELAGCELVRRPTGGGAILHDQELTYSLTLPSDWPRLAQRPSRLYELVHEAIRAVLADLGLSVEFHAGPEQGNAQRGPFFCFARRHRYDLLIGPDKVVGSAQRRRPNGVLQHGSIILRRVRPQPCTGVNDHLACPVEPGELIERLSSRLSGLLDRTLQPGGLSDAEEAQADRLRLKYASAAWTRQR